MKGTSGGNVVVGRTKLFYPKAGAWGAVLNAYT